MSFMRQRPTPPIVSGDRRVHRHHHAIHHHRRAMIRRRGCSAPNSDRRRSKRVRRHNSGCVRRLDNLQKNAASQLAASCSVADDNFRRHTRVLENLDSGKNHRLRVPDRKTHALVHTIRLAPGLRFRSGLQIPATSAPPFPPKKKSVAP